MPHVSQPYFNNGAYATIGHGRNWSVVVTETAIKRPASRNIEVIPCADRYTAWVMFRFASAQYRQENKTEDVTGRLPLDPRAFWDWRKALMLPKPQFKEFPAMGKADGMIPPESATTKGDYNGYQQAKKF